MADMLAQSGVNQTLSVAHTAAPGDGQGDLLLEAAAFDAELEAFGSGAARAPKRGPGRPPGTPNRSTLKLKQLMQAKGYRDPLEFLASIWTRDARDLAADLRPDGSRKATTFDQAHEAVKLQVRAAEAAMAYWHQKMPIAVEHSGDGQRPVIIINDGSFAPRASSSAETDTMSVHEVVQLQGVSDREAQASDDKGTASDG